MFQQVMFPRDLVSLISERFTWTLWLPAVLGFTNNKNDEVGTSGGREGMDG